MLHCFGPESQRNFGTEQSGRPVGQHAGARAPLFLATLGAKRRMAAVSRPPRRRASGGHVGRFVVGTSSESPLPFVKIRENEPFDIALRRFKRSCEKANILSEVRKREYYEKPTTVRKRKAAAAVKRHLKKLQREARRFERAF